MGKLGVIVGKDYPSRRVGADRVEDGYCGADGCAVTIASVYQFQLIFQNLGQILTSCLAILRHSKTFLRVQQK